MENFQIMSVRILLKIDYFMIFVHEEGSEVHFLEESGIICDIKFSFQTFKPTHTKRYPNRVDNGISLQK